VPERANAVTPSIADPERKKAVSDGPGNSPDSGEQPAAAEMNSASSEQLAHTSE
jgi:hypothetical protein